MPRYQVDLGSGGSYLVDTKEPATEEDLIKHVRQKFGKPELEEPKLDALSLAVDPTAASRHAPFFTAVERGLIQTGSLLTDVLPAVGASLIGADEYAKRQMEEAREKQEHIAKTLAPQIKSYKDVSDISDAGVYALETFGEQIPNLIGLIGGVGVAGAATKYVAGKVARKQIGKRLQKYGKRARTPSLNRLNRVAEEAVAKAAIKISHKSHLPAAMLGSYALNTPEIFQNIYEKTGEFAPVTALLFGSVAAALDSVLPYAVVRSLRSNPTLRQEVTKKLLEGTGANASVIRSLGVGVARGAAIEGVTESGQEAISILAERIVGDNWEAFTSEEFDRLIETGIRGAIVGAPLGGVSGTATGLRERAIEKSEEQSAEDTIEVGELSTKIRILENKIGNIDIDTEIGILEKKIAEAKKSGVDVNTEDSEKLHNLIRARKELRDLEDKRRYTQEFRGVSKKEKHIPFEEFQKFQDQKRKTKQQAKVAETLTTLRDIMKFAGIGDELNIEIRTWRSERPKKLEALIKTVEKDIAAEIEKKDKYSAGDFSKISESNSKIDDSTKKLEILKAELIFVQKMDSDLSLDDTIEGRSEEILKFLNSELEDTTLRTTSSQKNAISLAINSHSKLNRRPLEEDKAAKTTADLDDTDPTDPTAPPPPPPTTPPPPPPPAPSDVASQQQVIEFDAWKKQYNLKYEREKGGAYIGTAKDGITRESYRNKEDKTLYNGKTYIGYKNKNGEWNGKVLISDGSTGKTITTWWNDGIKDENYVGDEENRLHPSHPPRLTAAAVPVEVGVDVDTTTAQQLLRLDEITDFDSTTTSPFPSPELQQQVKEVLSERSLQFFEEIEARIEEGIDPRTFFVEARKKLTKKEDLAAFEVAEKAIKKLWPIARAAVAPVVTKPAVDKPVVVDEAAAVDQNELVPFVMDNAKKPRTGGKESVLDEVINAGLTLSKIELFKGKLTPNKEGWSGTNLLTILKRMRKSEDEAAAAEASEEIRRDAEEQRDVETIKTAALEGITPEEEAAIIKLLEENKNTYEAIAEVLTPERALDFLAGDMFTEMFLHPNRVYRRNTEEEDAQIYEDIKSIQEDKSLTSPLKSRLLEIFNPKQKLEARIKTLEEEIQNKLKIHEIRPTQKKEKEIGRLEKKLVNLREKETKLTKSILEKPSLWLYIKKLDGPIEGKKKGSVIRALRNKLSFGERAADFGPEKGGLQSVQDIKKSMREYVADRGRGRARLELGEELWKSYNPEGLSDPTEKQIAEGKKREKYYDTEEMRTWQEERIEWQKRASKKFQYLKYSGSEKGLEYYNKLDSESKNILAQKIDALTKEGARRRTEIDAVAQARAAKIQDVTKLIKRIDTLEETIQALGSELDTSKVTERNRLVEKIRIEKDEQLNLEVKVEEFRELIIAKVAARTAGREEETDELTDRSTEIKDIRDKINTLEGKIQTWEKELNNFISNPDNIKHIEALERIEEAKDELNAIKDLYGEAAAAGDETAINLTIKIDNILEGKIIKKLSAFFGEVTAEEVEITEEIVSKDEQATELFNEYRKSVRAYVAAKEQEEMYHSDGKSFKDRLTETENNMKEAYKKLSDFVKNPANKKPTEISLAQYEEIKKLKNKLVTLREKETELTERILKDPNFEAKIKTLEGQKQPWIRELNEARARIETLRQEVNKKLRKRETAPTKKQIAEGKKEEQRITKLLENVRDVDDKIKKLREPIQTLRKIKSDIEVSEQDIVNIEEAAQRLVRDDPSYLSNNFLLNYNKQLEHIHRIKEGKTEEQVSEKERWSLELKEITEGQRTSIKATEAVLIKRFGSEVLNHVVIAENPEAIGLIGQPSTLSGRVIDNKVYLFTDRIRQGNELAIVMHELGVHVGMKDFVGVGNYKFLIKKIGQFSRLKDNSPEAQIAKAALDRVKEAKITFPDLSEGDELIAYFVEEAVRRGIDPTQESQQKTSLGLFFKKIIAAAKRVLRRMGFNVKTIDAQEIVDYAYGAAKKAMRSPGEKINDVDEKMMLSLPSEEDNMMEAVFGVANNIIKSSPPWTQEFADGLANKLSVVPNWSRYAYYNLLGLRHLADTVKRYNPDLANLVTDLDETATRLQRAIDDRRKFYRNQLSIAQEYYNEAIKILKGRGLDNAASREHILKFYDLAHDTSIEQIDLREDNINEIHDQINRESITPEEKVVKKNKATELHGKFYSEAYPPQLREMYTLLVNSYEGSLNELINFYENSTGTALTSKQKSELGLLENVNKRIIPYLPLSRDGQYWVDLLTDEIDPTTGNKIRTSHAFKSPREAKIFIDQTEFEEDVEIMERDPSSRDKTKQEGVYRRPSRDPKYSGDATGLITSMIEKLQQSKNPIDDKSYYDTEAILKLRELWFDALGSNNLRQQYKKRKGIKGFERDMLANFASMGLKYANELSTLEIRPRLDNTLAAIGTLGEGRVSSAEDSVLASVRYRAPFLRSPTPGRAFAFAAYGNYWFLLLGNISSAAVNFTQLPLVTFGLLTGEYGPDKAASAIANGFKLYINGGKDDNTRLISPFTKRSLADRTLFTEENMRGNDPMRVLYETALSRGAIRRTTSQELQDLKRGDVNSLSGVYARAELSMSWLFQNSERANREISLIANFNLAKEAKNIDGSLKYTTDEAIEKAIIDVDRANGPALVQAGPAYFTDGIGKVIGTFKRFAFSQLYLQWQLARDAFGPDQYTDADVKLPAGAPTVRQIAKAQLFATMIPAWTFAGIRGLPLYGLVEIGASLYSGIFGDDDDLPFDLYMRNAAGDMGYRGPLGHFLNVDFASRTGFYALAFRQDRYRRAEVGDFSYAVEAFFGPSYSIWIRNPQRALEHYRRGDTGRAVESITPSFWRNLQQGVRYAREGILTTKGDKLIDDLHYGNIAMKMMGFTPEELSRQYAENEWKTRVQRDLDLKKTSLLNRHYGALITSDTKGLMETKREINKFNRRLNVIKLKEQITSKTLQRSETTRRNRKVVGGLTMRNPEVLAQIAGF